jgi:hypothetical protein
MQCSYRPLRELPISSDPRADFLGMLASDLPGHRLARRRILREIEHHLDDCVADLRASGMTEAAAVSDAVARMGRPEMIGAAFRTVRPNRRLSWRSAAVMSPAWLIAGVLSIAVAWAAESPPTSGAKTPPSISVRYPPAPSVGNASHRDSRRRSGTTRRRRRDPGIRWH